MKEVHLNKTSCARYISGKYQNRSRE